MEKTRYLLGRTNVALSPIGLGCWQFSKGRGLAGRYWPSLSDETTVAIVRTCLNGGINCFDTAEAYGNGASEQSLSMALQAAGVEPGAVVVATKWMPVFRTASSISKTIDDRISSLSPYPIDLHQIHNPGSLSGIPAQIERMAALLQENTVRAIGVSNFSARQFAKAQDAAQRAGVSVA
ncbi:MAG: aldo/keto reductase, partial [Spirochaetes bacterium]|nr:aldo/keto reductase [Spirochaetota bacterium]